MKWNNTSPRLGDIRETIKFAWFPVDTEDRKTVWLENYRRIEVYYDYGDYGYGWATIERHTITPQENKV